MSGTLGAAPDGPRAWTAESPCRLGLGLGGRLSSSPPCFLVAVLGRASRPGYWTSGGWGTCGAGPDPRGGSELASQLKPSLDQPTEGPGLSTKEGVTRQHLLNLTRPLRPQFSSVQSLSRVRLFVTPWTGSVSRAWVVNA